MRRFGAPVVVTALLVVAAFAAALGSPGFGLARAPAKPQTELVQLAPTAAVTVAPVAVPPTAPVETKLPTWLSVGLIVLLGLAAVVVVSALLWYLIRDAARRRRDAAGTRPPTVPAPTTGEVVDAIDAGLADLSDTDGDPRRAVIACWVRLEEAAAAAGTPRRPSDAPTDLVARLLAAHQVSRAVLDPFAAAYSEARYATHVVDTEMRSVARSALGQLRAELRAEFSGAVRPGGPPHRAGPPAGWSGS